VAIGFGPAAVTSGAKDTGKGHVAGHVGQMAIGRIPTAVTGGYLVTGSGISKMIKPSRPLTNERFGFNINAC